MNPIGAKNDGGRIGNQEMDLARLREGMPGITEEFGACLAQAGAVCLEEQGHLPGAMMAVDGELERHFAVLWDRVTEQMKRCWGDVEVATEHGAYGVAVLLVQTVTEYTIVERSRKGTGFDFWLGRADDREPLFQGKARLEVSGIRRGDNQAINERVRKKTRQMSGGNDRLPGMIIVVEFGEPRSRVVNR